MDKFVLVKGKAGLGNRILSALTGILYARLTHRRLIIDWSDFTYSNDSTNVFPLLFTSPDADPTLEVFETGSVSPTLWRTRLKQDISHVIEEIDPSAHTSHRSYRQFSVDLSRLDHPEKILVLSSYTHLIPRLRKHFRGEFAYLAQKSDEDILTELLQTALFPHPSICSRIEQWQNKHFGSDPVVGVHVRFLDTRLPLFPSISRKTSIESFFNVTDQIVGKRPSSTIFIATDSQKVQRAFEQRYDKVISTQKWFPRTDENEKTVEMHQNPECPDRLQNAVDAITDMYLLARCDYLVFPKRSTFSYISSLNTKMNPSNINDVERYDPIVWLAKYARRWLS